MAYRPWPFFILAALPALLLPGCTIGGMGGFPSLAPLPAPQAAPAQGEMFGPPSPPVPAPATGLDGMIARYGTLYDVPESLIRRVIQRESGFNPKARHGPYWGLMQIRYDTARSMGYRGPAAGLLDADTNLRYGIKYLAGAYIVAGRNPDQAIRYFASGYYYEAKRKGLLDAVGL